ncbi:hypothetical protein FVR03_04985 [Pontibacter qinzhouensis]|uniref:Uncharacterized protein n=1 Tax=Pontibacter qinzhouensis TaxID=2603253 RepID=A0A5C8K974_9BACT|nr:hypothetical protein [Pontibacter qinzhouensis]TXK50538.1 hypothetical protein FVR03_04985 [Pontibacter qinzhouensis]
MSENLIVITGGAYTDVKKALKQWILLYAEDLEADFACELFPGGRGRHVIQVDKRLANEHFFYLINYLFYPENITYKIDVLGFTTAEDQALLQQAAINVYVSKSNNPEFDNVQVVTAQNQSYKIDFSGNITRATEAKMFSQPPALPSGIPERITLKQVVSIPFKIKNPPDNPAKRFGIIASLAFVWWVISVILIFFEKSWFYQATFFLGLGFMGWFFSDYKMLQHRRYYIYCLLIALAFLGYGQLVQFSLQESKMSLLEFGCNIPVAVLLTQKPIRLLFLKLWKREPVVDKPAPSLVDGLYMLLLLAVPLFLLILLGTRIK